MKIVLLSFVAAVVFSSAAAAQGYKEEWHHNHHRERYYETVCRQEFRGHDSWGRPVYREVCWQEERWR
jgi:hypothetical protein